MERVIRKGMKKSALVCAKWGNTDVPIQADSCLACSENVVVIGNFLCYPVHALSLA